MYYFNHRSESENRINENIETIPKVSYVKIKIPISYKVYFKIQKENFTRLNDLEVPGLYIHFSLSDYNSKNRIRKAKVSINYFHKVPIHRNPIN